MPYCTLTDILKLLPEETVVQLTDDEGTGAVHQTRVDEAIAQADAEIDSYCGARYSVPFSPAPDIVRKCSVDIAVYNLYSRRTEEIPEARSERYKNAIRQLEGIARGVITLGVDPPPAGSQVGQHGVDVGSEDRRFSRTKLEDF